MPDFLSPDVVTQEVQGNSGQIPTVSTSAFALAGYSPRGPEGKAFVHTSFQEFVARFGSFSKKSYNAYAAAAYFLNGGSQLIFSRELHGDATFATGAFPGTWNVQASGRGIWANDAVITISGNPSFFDSVSGNYSAFDLTVQLIDPTSGLLTTSETFDALNLTDPSNPSYILNILPNESEDVVFFANTGGIPEVLTPDPQTNILFATGVSGQTNYSGSVSGAGVPILPGSLVISVSGVSTAKDDMNGNLVTTGASTVSGTVDYAGGAIAIFISPAPLVGQQITATYIQEGAPSVSVTLLGGTDGSAVVAADVVSVALQPDKAGIYAFDLIEDQFQLALPDFAGDPTTDQALLTYAENRADILVLLQPPKGSTPQQAVNYKRNILKSVSSYGAMYYPWIAVPDPLNNNYPYLIPPTGHVAGRCAFTDQNANVGKATAGVTRGQLSFISGVERVLDKGSRDIVYPAQINPIRSDAQVGNAIWGNRTLQVVGDYINVNIRRLFIYLEKTQYVGLLDIVFEDVGPVEFGIVKARLDSFLEQLWINNVIGSGVTNKDQAFKVICDSSNNPPSTQAALMIIADEYIKPNLAAEIILLRIQRVFDASQI